MTVERLFPQGRRVNERPAGADRVGLPLDGGEWLDLRRQDLSEREWALVETFLNEKTRLEEQKRQPWELFLTGAQGATVPAPLGAIQVLWISSMADSDEQWLNLLRQALPNVVAAFRPQKDLWAVVLDQTRLLEVTEVVTEMLPAIEFDFSAKLKIGLGQVWTKEFWEKWPDLFAAEGALFGSALPVHQWGASVSMGRAVLEVLARAHQVEPVLLACLRTILLAEEQMDETVTAMWLEAAVVTKAAQRLYVHRNTLQNRLEKFRDEAGLNLKDLDDLFLCRLALTGGWD